MNTLAGRASYGQRTGTIKVNGAPDRLENYMRVMGFVPQARPWLFSACLATAESRIASASSRSDAWQVQAL